MTSIKQLYHKNTQLFQYIGLFLLFISLFLLVANSIGIAMREKIIITSSLDFSWFSDAIERLLHGYLLGRDFTFTYGPLFQIIYALPSLLFGVPSYISVAFSPLLSFVILFFLVLAIAKMLTKNYLEQICYILFLFIVVGLLISHSTDTVRIMAPIFYALLLFVWTDKKISIRKVLLLGALPTLFGLYTYNIFITCYLFAGIFFVIRYYESKSINKNINFIWLLVTIGISQIFCSLLLTHNFDYLNMSFDAVSNYRYLMNLIWTRDRINLLLIFPLLLTIVFFMLTKLKTNKVTNTLLIKIKVLILIAILQMIYAVSRSDAGHLLYAVYPSIIVFYTIVFFFGHKIRWLLVIGFFLYILVPFKPNFSNTLAPSNLVKVVQAITEKPSFFEIYKLDEHYYYSEKEIKYLATFVKDTKDAVYVYPYDSYILNIVGKTYNSYALGTYTYSNSLVEKKTYEGLIKNPPKKIILGIDTKGTLNLDDVANFTRNPQIATWIVSHYNIQIKTEKYLILDYDPNKNKTLKNKCIGYELVIDLAKKDDLSERLIALLKPPVYYLANQRLPYTRSNDQYLVFSPLTTATDLTRLIKGDSINKMPSYFTNNYGIVITRISPFLGRKNDKSYTKDEFSFRCHNNI